MNKAKNDIFIMAPRTERDTASTKTSTLHAVKSQTKSQNTIQNGPATKTAFLSSIEKQSKQNQKQAAPGYKSMRSFGVEKTSATSQQLLPRNVAPANNLQMCMGIKAIVD